jgi:hypothetical protein
MLTRSFLLLVASIGVASAARAAEPFEAFKEYQNTVYDLLGVRYDPTQPRELNEDTLWPFSNPAALPYPAKGATFTIDHPTIREEGEYRSLAGLPSYDLQEGVALTKIRFEKKTPHWLSLTVSRDVREPVTLSLTSGDQPIAEVDAGFVSAGQRLRIPLDAPAAAKLSETGSLTLKASARLWIVALNDSYPRLGPGFWGGGEEADFRDHLQVVAAYVATYQNDAGLWHNFIEDPEQRIDTSGSAGIACALALCANRGWIDASYRDRAEKAYNAIQAYLVDGGFLSYVAPNNKRGPSEAAQRANRRTCEPFALGLLGQLHAALLESRSGISDEKGLEEDWEWVREKEVRWATAKKVTVE